MQAMGATQDTIFALMLADLEDGGRLFGTMENGIKNTIKDALGMANGMGKKQAYSKAGVTLKQWGTRSGGKSCPDCAARAGRVETQELWTAVGEPQSGFSVCRQHCRCELVPGGYQGETTIQTKDLK